MFWQPRYVRLNLLVPFGLLCLLTACEPKYEKTHSMLRRDNAIKEASALVLKANALFTQEVHDAPSQHLDDLILIYRHLQDAHSVYETAKITNWDHPELVALEQRVLQLNPELAKVSIELFERAISMAKELKQQKREIELLPVSDNRLAAEAFASSADVFDKQLTSCCVDKAMLINRFLNRERERYYELIKLNSNIQFYMGNFIQGKVSESQLNAMLKQIVDELNRSHE